MTGADRFKEVGRNILAPLARFLAKKNVPPNLITTLGLIPSICSFFFYLKGWFPIGGAFIALAGLFDILDGQVARIENKVTTKGAYLDSNLDRISDFLPLLGIAIYYMSYNALVTSLTFLLMLGVFMVSYARARAEGVGIECKVGPADRTFRMIFLIIGSMFGVRIFVWFLIFLIATTYGTFITRIIYSMRRL